MVSTGKLTVEPIGDDDRDTVVALWESCGLTRSYNPPQEDIALAAGKPNSDVLVGFLGEKLVASVLVGHDGHRGWIYYLAVLPEHQRGGLGAQMVNVAEEWLRARGIRKVQLMIRETNTGVIGFYERLGYERSPVAVMQRWLDGTMV